MDPEHLAPHHTVTRRKSSFRELQEKLKKVDNTISVNKPTNLFNDISSIIGEGKIQHTIEEESSVGSFRSSIKESLISSPSATSFYSSSLSEGRILFLK